MQRFFERIEDSSTYLWIYRRLSSLQDRYYNLKNYLINIVRFRRELREYREWDYTHSFAFLQKALEIQADSIEEISRHVGSHKTVKDIRRVTDIIDKHIRGDSISDCEICQKVWKDDVKTINWPLKDGMSSLEFVYRNGKETEKLLATHTKKHSRKRERELDRLFVLMREKHTQWWD